MKRIPDYCEIFFPLKKVQKSFGPHAKTQARKGTKFFLRLNFKFFAAYPPVDKAMARPRNCGTSRLFFKNDCVQQGDFA